MMEHVKTTTDCLRGARKILEESKRVSTREEHAQVWDKKAELLNTVNGAFETGYFTGRAYDELREAKSILLTAESIAGNRARETYTRKLE